MAKEKLYRSIISHPDREEIIAKLTLSLSESDIHDWLAAKYPLPKEKKFVVAASTLKKFKKDHLDFYHDILADVSSAKNQIQKGEDPSLVLANSSAYKQAIMKAAENEIDIRTMIKNLCTSLETRYAAVYDTIMNDPDHLDLRLERLLLEQGETLTNMVSKLFDIVEGPQNQQTTNNIQVNIVSDHVAVIQDCIRETLAQMDTESSLFFMDLFSQKMENLKAKDLPASTKLLSQNEKMAQVEILQETIGQKLN